MTFLYRTDDVTGVILAGGKSTRMGEEKALLDLNGKPFIEIIFSRMQNVFKRVIVVTENSKKFVSLNIFCYEDIIKNMGPLGGLFTALKVAETDFIFLTTCDMPLICEEVIETILKVKSKDKIVVGRVGSDLLPLFGLYPKVVLFQLSEILQIGEKRVIAFINKTGFESVDLSNFKDKLLNINNKEEYKKLLDKRF